MSQKLSKQSSDFISKYSLLWLFLILVLAFLLRLYKIDSHGIFFDEKATMMVSQGIVQDGGNQHDVFDKGKLVFTNIEFWNPQTLEEYYEAMRRSDIGNSPFYYLLLHFWIRLTNTSDFSVRFFSLIFSVLIVAEVYFISKYFLKSINVALLAAFLTAIEPFFITYSQQARNYSLTFFLTLLASYFFLRAVEEKNISKKWFWLYGVTAGLSLMSHFLAISVLLGHGIFAILKVRNVKTWIYLVFAAVIALLPITWWLMCAGGTWTLKTLSYQSAVYLECALNRPFNNPYGTILPASNANVAQKSIPIFTDMWIYANSLVGNLDGNKNLLVSFMIGLLLIFSFENRKYTKQLEILSALALVLSYFFYSNNPLKFEILSVSILMLFLGIKFLFNKTNLKNGKIDFSLFVIILALVPTLFLIFNAFRSGHTYGLTQRYSGFSFPFVMVVASGAFLELFSSKFWLKYVIVIVILSQFYFLTQTLNSFYNDESLKYNYRVVPRLPNPHYKIANQLKMQYEVGDTVLIPAPKNVFDNEIGRTFLPYSVTDAQYINLYLPKNVIFVQKLDTLEINKVFLKKKSGKKIQLIDLKDKRY